MLDEENTRKYAEELVGESEKYKIHSDKEQVGWWIMELLELFHEPAQVIVWLKKGLQDRVTSSFKEAIREAIARIEEVTETTTSLADSTWPLREGEDEHAS